MNSLKNWSIGRLLTASFLTLVALFGLFAIAQSFVFRTTLRAVTPISNSYLPEMALTSEFEREVLNARIFFIYHVTIEKPGALQSGWKRFHNARVLLPSLLALVNRQESLAQLRTPTAKLVTDIDLYEACLRKVLQTVAEKNNHGDAFALLLKEWAKRGGELVTAAGDLNAECAKLSMSSSTDAAAQLSWTTTFSIGACIFIALVAGGIGFSLITNSRKRLHSITTALDSYSRLIARTSSDLATQSESLSQGATAQAAELSETSIFCQRISAMAVESSSTAQTVAEMMNVSQQRTATAKGTLEQSHSAMTEISASSQKVAGIAKVVDDIAFQTGILGLNASIEAALAGQSGLGFAIVASEVRSLAQRSATAAKQTVEIMEESSLRTSTGRDLVGAAAGNVRDMFDESIRAKSLAESLSSASAEQTKAISQIANAVKKIEAVTQRTVDGAEQTRSAASTLSAQSEQIRKAANVLHVFAGSK